MCESSNNYSINTGNGYYGAYQFDLATWRSVGGSGYPNQASPAEQDARALILYRERGWQPWTCAQHPRPARGQRRPQRAHQRHQIGGKPPAGRRLTPRGKIPPFPGTRWYRYGDNNAQHQDLPGRDAPAAATSPPAPAQYGPLTLRMVKQLQRLNGLVPNGYIGPNTWRLAWTGRTPPHRTAPSTRRHDPGRSRARAGTATATTTRNIKTFQDEMHRRGYFPVGTGHYGPLTLHMVKQLQRLNGLVPNGSSARTPGGWPGPAATPQTG